MARSQSPGYPQFALPKAISAVRKIFEADRRNPIDRSVAQKHIGYSGPSGAADKALATLAHYGLVERVGKGEVRVSQLTVDILHPDSDVVRRRALLEAGFNPQVYKDLRDRFGDHVSENALHSYLVRENFLDRAIGPVSNGYLETIRYLEQEKAFESRGNAASEVEESAASENDWNADMDDTAVLERPAPAIAPVAAPVPQVEVGETEWMRNPLGRGKSVRVLVTGDMGTKEIGKLIKLLEAQKAVLDDDDEEDQMFE
ncbi:hypothetical protein [Alteraurantiacibacter buctensis]|uniref:Uncharacterized protein n=1 Tax=Alteraurantiacibacter buctensis TaxID=1503981 RepID=A0A844YVH6_9SPHN|nr:hypothetical protein [Alteraurantiacibacter buctensis]MXO70908.1 hypothetical protein [Alteraurantiacibacter buctensis]